MHAFHLEPKMRSFFGGFYPTGHCFLMLPTEAHARRAEMLLAQSGIDCTDVSLLTPQDVLELAAIFDRHDVLLPSMGTDRATTHHFAELAAAGHHALLVPARNQDACSKVMAALHDAGVSHAVHYRHFVIEDLVA